MAYVSQINVMKEKFLSQTVERFYKDMNDLLRDEARQAWGKNEPHQLGQFYAEQRMWTRLFGNLPFPGKFPSYPPPMAPIVFKPNPQPTPRTTMIPAGQMQSTIEDLLRSRYPEDAPQPMFGWNPKTGEPWLAIRLEAQNSLSALQGYGVFNHIILNPLATSSLADTLVIKYVKLSTYILFWPEFAAEGCRLKRQAWMDLATLRAFLQDWSTPDSMGNVEIIDFAYQRLLRSPDYRHSRRVMLKLPPDFPLDQSFLAITPPNWTPEETGHLPGSTIDRLVEPGLPKHRETLNNYYNEYTRSSFTSHGSSTSQGLSTARGSSTSQGLSSGHCSSTERGLSTVTEEKAGERKRAREEDEDADDDNRDFRRMFRSGNQQDHR